MISCVSIRTQDPMVPVGLLSALVTGKVRMALVILSKHAGVVLGVTGGNYIEQCQWGSLQPLSLGYTACNIFGCGRHVLARIKGE